MLGSNNYLGLTTHPEVIEAGVKAYQEFGSGCSGSRFLNGTLTLHLELEAELARFLGKPGIVTFSTGFQSNLGIISAIVGMHDYVIMDRENHASLYDGCRLSYGKMLRFRHNDMEDLEKKLQKVPESAGCLIVTDGVFSMARRHCKSAGDLPSCQSSTARASWSTTPTASASSARAAAARPATSGSRTRWTSYMGTFSKSLASPRRLHGRERSRSADYVRHNSRPFIFSASIPPANCAAALAALRILEREAGSRHQLAANALHLARKAGREAHQDARSPTASRTRPSSPSTLYEEITHAHDRARSSMTQGVYVNSVAAARRRPRTSACCAPACMATHTRGTA